MGWRTEERGETQRKFIVVKRGIRGCPQRAKIRGPEFNPSGEISGLSERIDVGCRPIV